MNKETNLEHYKKELTEIFIANCYNQLFIAKRIAGRLDKNMKCSDQASYMEGILDWMAQPYKELILDDVEKAYLSAVIKPFRNNVNYISKIDVNYPAFKQFISIKVNHTQCVNLPNFSKKSGMYKGMETNKHYSLEELGL